jgi:TRAP-type C4-dicarboxylate transport system substrate-binding protein
MTITPRMSMLAAVLAGSVLSISAAFGQPAKPAAPTTLSFNWEGAYGRANILVWPFRPGGRFEELVAQHTRGSVRLDIKDKLFGLMDSAFAIGDGRVMMGTQSIPAASGTYPLLDFGGIPGLFSDMPNGATEYANALLDPKMMAALDETTKRGGFKVLGAAISLANDALWGNKPIKTLADFKGVKMRASGRTQTSALRALGGSPLTLSVAEIEQALSRGTVDAITTSKSFGAERGLTRSSPRSSPSTSRPGTSSRRSSSGACSPLRLSSRARCRWRSSRWTSPTRCGSARPRPRWSCPTRRR